MSAVGDGARPFTPEQLSVAQRVCALRQGAYYEILEVDEQASEAEIKRAFKSLALQLHPDKNAAPGAEDAFKMVAEAYEVLGNAQDRAAYDNERRGGFAAFNEGFYANNDDVEYDDPPPFRPRTPAPNETRKQRRQREYEDRQARQRAKDHAERNARRREKERRRASRFGTRGDMLNFFARIGVHFIFCSQCDRVHLQMGDEPVEHDPPLGPRRPEPHRHHRADSSQQRAANETPAQPRGAQPEASPGDVPVDAEIPVPPSQQNAPHPASSDAPGPENASFVGYCILIPIMLAVAILIACILFKAMMLVWAAVILVWAAAKLVWAAVMLVLATDVARSLLMLGVVLLIVLFGPVCLAMLRYGPGRVFVVRGASVSLSGVRPVEFLTPDVIFEMMNNFVQ